MSLKLFLWMANIKTTNKKILCFICLIFPFSTQDFELRYPLSRIYVNRTKEIFWQNLLLRVNKKTIAHCGIYYILRFRANPRIDAAIINFFLLIYFLLKIAFQSSKLPLIMLLI